MKSLQMYRFIRSKGGSTLIWALIALLVISILLAGGLLLAGAYFNRNVISHTKNQAYYTSYSVARAVAKWLVDETAAPIADADRIQILDDLKNRDWNFRLDTANLGQGMGDCDVTIAYSDDTLEKIDITADAHYQEQRYTMIATVRTPEKRSQVVESESILELDGEFQNESTLTITRAGVYRLEVWGAQGGGNGTGLGRDSGGKGGYAAGEVYLDKGVLFYAKAGGKGQTVLGANAPGGFNGGGKGGIRASHYSAGGGGASDLRIGKDDYGHRLIVAGGGGGAGSNHGNDTTTGSGGAGGGLTGKNGERDDGAFGYGGTQIAGGAVGWDQGDPINGPGSFGLGGSEITSKGPQGSASGGGGGGGWYGGGAGAWDGGGGGSAYVLTAGSIKPPSYDVDSKFNLSNVVMTSGEDPMPDPRSETKIRGKNGAGYVKITLILPDLATTTDPGGSLPSGLGEWYSDSGNGPDMIELDGEKESESTWVVPKTALYRLEAWGAQGGDGGYGQFPTCFSSGGKGGYSAGELHLKKGTVLYLKAGGPGQGYNPRTLAMRNNTMAGGANGGGTSTSSPTGYSAPGGGGGSDIRIGTDSLYARVLVAGGGGGGGAAAANTPQSSNGGPGGGPVAPTLANSTQINSAKPGEGGQASAGFSFGTGQSATTVYTGSGGGGWWGGHVGAANTGGGGGSGFVFTALTKADTPSAYLLRSVYYLSSVSCIPGDANMPNPTAPSTSILGKSGAGFVRVTNLSADSSNARYRVTSYSPAMDTTAGGETITIHGDGFLDLPSFFTATPYVPDGLILHWDGRDNTGTGVHSDNTTTWQDLSGEGNHGTINTIGGAGSIENNWKQNGFLLNGGTVQRSVLSPSFGNKAQATIQIALNIPGDYSAAAALNTIAFNAYGSPDVQGLWRGDGSYGISWWATKSGSADYLSDSKRKAGVQTQTVLFDDTNKTVRIKSDDESGAHPVSATANASPVSLANNMSPLYQLRLERLLSTNSVPALTYFQLRFYERLLTDMELAQNYAADVERVLYLAPVSLRIGGLECKDVKVTSDHTITAVVPPHPEGENDMTLSLYGQDLTIEDGFVYLDPAPPSHSVVLDEDHCVNQIETFTVPETGEYRLEAWGAQGGGVGLVQGFQGAYARSYAHLTKGQNLKILVGGQGGYGAGGGGSFVTRDDDVPLVVAGGGGGQGGQVVAANNRNIANDVNYGQFGQSGGTVHTDAGNPNGGGAAGQGGENGHNSEAAPGGGGLIGNGKSSANVANGFGKAFVNGGQGGIGGGTTMTAGGNFPPGDGGFGGGAGAFNNNTAGYFHGGGGGGFSGGQGGTYAAALPVQNAAGGGGGSWFTGVGGYAIAGNAAMPSPRNPAAEMLGKSGDGWIRITLLQESKPPDTTEVLDVDRNITYRQG